MYEQFFGLAENPFSLTPDPRFIFGSRSHDEAVAHLRYWVEHHEGFATITGEVGTGKTTALFRLIEGMDRHVEVAFVTNSRLSPVELLEEICRRFRIDLDRDLSKPALLSKLEAYLLRLNQLGHGAVLIIDEAQNFDHSLLEEVRLLSNLTRSGGTPLLQIALVGQPELERRLNLPELRQLKQRIGVHYKIEPLSGEETASYIHHRVAVAGGAAGTLFPPETTAAVHATTFGLPREINQVASQALLHAYVEESPIVRPEHIASAVEEMGFKSVLDRGVTLTMARPIGAESRIETRAEPKPEPRGGAMPRPAETLPKPAALPPRAVPAPAVAAGRAANPVSGPATHRTPPTFQAIPPIHAPSGHSLRPANPAMRRLALTGAIIVILGASALLLFGRPKTRTDDLAQMESEPTIPVSTSPEALKEPALTRIIPGIDAAKVNPQTSGPAAVGAPAAGDSIERKATLPAGSEGLAGAGGNAGASEIAGTGVAAPGTTVRAGESAARDSVDPRDVVPPSRSRMERDAMAGYHLQVASLRDSNVAESLGRRLGRLSESAFHIDRFPGGDFPWYAVYLGPYETRAEAESVRVQLIRIDSHLEGSLIRPPATP